MDRKQDPIGYGLKAKAGELNECFECQALTTGLHHVVPVSRGGTKRLPLCPDCHNRAHDSLLIHPVLVRDGLDRARIRGVKLGAPVKVGSAHVATAISLRKQGLSYRKISESLGLSLGTTHKILSTI